MVFMTVGSELWFGLFKSVEGEVQRRLEASANVFDALLLERFGQGRPGYREYRLGIEIPNQLSPFSDSHVAMAGLLLAGTNTGEDGRALASVLDAGLKKIAIATCES